MRPRPPVVRPVPGATAVFLFAAAFSAAFIFAIAAALAAACFAAFFLLSEALDLAAAILAYDATLICFEVHVDLVGPLSDLPYVSLGGIMLLLI